MLLKSDKKSPYDQVFPSHTPVPFEDGTEVKEVPKFGASLADRFYKKFTRRIYPLLKVRETMDKVYSNGYFQQHYRDADIDLKRELNNQAKIAHSRLLAEDDSMQDEHYEEEIETAPKNEERLAAPKNFTITLNIPTKV